MTTFPDESALTPPPAGPKPNPFSRIVGAIIAPVDTFNSIAERPDWVVPFLLVIVFVFLSTILGASHIDIEGSMRKQMASRDMTPAQVDRAIEIGMKMQKFNAVIVVVIVPVVLLIVATVLLFAFRAFGGEGTFRQSLAITSYAWMPFLIQGILTLILLMSRQGVLQQDMATILMSNPGAFLTDANPIVLAILSSLDVFTFWVLALMVVGYSAMSRLTRGQSAAIVIGLWLVVVLFKVGAASVGMMMGKH